MYIGKLNDRLENVKLLYCDMNTGAPVSLKENGDPLKNEALIFTWSLSGVRLDISFSGEFFIERLILTLGNASTPKGIRLFDNDGALICAHTAETGKTVLEREIHLLINKKTNGFYLEIDSNFNDIEITDISLYGAEVNGISLFPVPQRVVEYGKKVPITNFKGIKCESSALIHILNEKLQEKTGITLPEREDGNVVFRHDGSLKENAYSLTVNEQLIVISASDYKGSVQGIETLIKLIDGNTLPLSVVQDEPFCQFRGVHLYLPAVENIGFFKALIKYLLSPMGYNHIILELCGAMEFRSHPEINEAFNKANENYKNGIWPKLPHGTVGGGKTVPQDMIRELVEYSRLYGIEIIPEIQSLGHVQFMTLAHPEIAEIPVDKPEADHTDARLADVPPDQFYAHSFCPSNERSYEILFDIMEEVIEVFSPKKYVHMGHDEVYQIGVCPVCSKKDPAELFYNDVMRLYDFLKKKGLSMMIWADMLQEASAYKTVPAVKKLPKDIVLLDFIWYFHLDKDIEENLLKYGYKLIFGNMYSSHFPRFESRIRKENVLGGQLSAWVSTDEHTLQREGKLYDFLYTANMLWSEDYTKHCRHVYDGMVRSLIPTLRNKFSSAPIYEAGTEFKENTKAEYITFFHGTKEWIWRMPWAENEVLGEYLITYTDGTSESIKIVNSENIYHMFSDPALPLENAFYRHNGYNVPWYSDPVTNNGKTLYRYTVKNPHKEKTIASITLNPLSSVKIVTERIEVK